MLITRQRMHLIGLALAHLDNRAQPEIAHFLLRGRVRDILDFVLGRRPRGLKRALKNLSFEVLSPEGYRRLIDLLSDPASFKVLAHAHHIDDDDLERLHHIPAPLRPILIPAMATASPMSFIKGRLIEGLRLLVMLGVAPSLDALVDDLKGFPQPRQLSAHMRKLIKALPLPTEIPPTQIGPARRLNSSHEICDLAKQWRNCLENSIFRVSIMGNASFICGRNRKHLLPAQLNDTAAWAGFLQR